MQRFFRGSSMPLDISDIGAGSGGNSNGERLRDLGADEADGADKAMIPDLSHEGRSSNNSVQSGKSGGKSRCRGHIVIHINRYH